MENFVIVLMFVLKLPKQRAARNVAGATANSTEKSFMRL